MKIDDPHSNFDLLNVSSAPRLCRSLILRVFMTLYLLHNSLLTYNKRNSAPGVRSRLDAIGSHSGRSYCLYNAISYEPKQ